MKLTNAMRDAMIDQAMGKAFDARDKAHDKATTKLADAAYAHEYGAVEKAANKLPQGWCSMSTTVLIDCAGFGYYGRRDSQKNSMLRMSKERRVPRYQTSNPVKIGGGHPLFEQAQAVADEYQAINRDKDELRAKLRAVVYAATTVEKLLAAWPECEAFLPASTPKPAGALVPVELVPELNAALNLKTKLKKAA